MSQQLIDHNPDLKRLVDEGFQLEIQGEGLLLVHSVPYVNPEAKARDDGLLVMVLSPGPNNTLLPADHTAHFKGETPSHADGSPLSSIINNSNGQTVGNIQVNHYLSAKATYKDSYHKVKTYVSLISRHARELNRDLTAQVKKQAIIVDDPLFFYADTAASLAGIGHLNNKLAQERVAIIGLGGTGTHILDLIVRCHIGEIHLFDGDVFLANNAYRSPVPPTLEEVSAQRKKVEFFSNRYAGFRKNGLIPHDLYVRADTVEELRGMNFVFICLDDDTDKRVIVSALSDWGIPFIDVGLGIQLTEDDKLTGIIRTTLVTPEKNDHSQNRIRYSKPGVDELYNHNIQIADLNALNAVLAVMRWKKYMGYYADYFNEHYSLFMLSGNRVINKDQP